MSDAPEPWRDLLELSHALGREERRLAILGEGNTSMRSGSDSFVVKASGSNLGSLTAAGLVDCRLSALETLRRARDLDDAAIDDGLLAARLDPTARKPSVEAIFHAYLLTLPGVNFVGHTHPVAVNRLLCSRYAQEFAERRLFPDEVVCCGAESVIIPYVDPGLQLARAIETQVVEFVQRTARAPRLILLVNHGLIALGATPAAVLAATLMAVKAAEIFAGAAALGGPRFLTPAQVERIAGRRDEHYREKVLGLGTVG